MRRSKLDRSLRLERSVLHSAASVRVHAIRAIRERLRAVLAQLQRRLERSISLQLYATHRSNRRQLSSLNRPLRVERLARRGRSIRRRSPLISKRTKHHVHAAELASERRVLAIRHRSLRQEPGTGHGHGLASRINALSLRDGHRRSRTLRHSHRHRSRRRRVVRISVRRSELSGHLVRTNHNEIVGLQHCLIILNLDGLTKRLAVVLELHRTSDALRHRSSQRDLVTRHQRIRRRLNLNRGVLGGHGERDLGVRLERRVLHAAARVRVDAVAPAFELLGFILGEVEGRREGSVRLHLDAASGGTTNRRDISGVDCPLGVERDACTGRSVLRRLPVLREGAEDDVRACKLARKRRTRSVRSGGVGQEAGTGHGDGFAIRVDAGRLGDGYRDRIALRLDVDRDLRGDGARECISVGGGKRRYQLGRSGGELRGVERRNSIGNCDRVRELRAVRGECHRAGSVRRSDCRSQLHGIAFGDRRCRSSETGGGLDGRHLHGHGEGERHGVQRVSGLVEHAAAKSDCAFSGERRRGVGPRAYVARDGRSGKLQRCDRCVREAVGLADLGRALELVARNVHTQFRGGGGGHDDTRSGERPVENVLCLAIDLHAVALEVHSVACGERDICRGAIGGGRTRPTGPGEGARAVLLGPAEHRDLPLGDHAANVIAEGLLDSPFEGGAGDGAFSCRRSRGGDRRGKSKATRNEQCRGQRRDERLTLSALSDFHA